MVPKVFLSLLGLLCFVASGSSSAGPFEECRDKNPAWYTCASDEECVQIYNPCGWPDDTANKNFSAQAEECNRHVGAALSCVEVDFKKLGGPFSAKCINGTCVAAERF
jgi:hypothetical protein